MIKVNESIREFVTQLTNEQLFAVWFLIGAALVFWMQAGFAMVEAGFTRAKNTGNIIMKNLMDFCIGTVTFILNGYNLLKEPVKITVNKTSGDVTKTYPMINTDTPKLTPTGGAAYGVMIGGAGIAVLGAALVWILVKAKKKNKKDAAE